MKKRWLALGALALVTSVAFASELYTEFQAREAKVFTLEERNALNFLRTLGYDVEAIEELEALDSAGRFLIRDKNGKVCLGDQKAILLRCKTKIGITTVLPEGDSD